MNNLNKWIGRVQVGKNHGNAISVLKKFRLHFSKRDTFEVWILTNGNYQHFHSDKKESSEESVALYHTSFETKKNVTCSELSSVSFICSWPFSQLAFVKFLVLANSGGMRSILNIGNWLLFNALFICLRPGTVEASQGLFCHYNRFFTLSVCLSALHPSRYSCKDFLRASGTLLNGC